MVHNFIDEYKENSVSSIEWQNASDFSSWQSSGNEATGQLLDRQVRIEKTDDDSRFVINKILRTSKDLHSIRIKVHAETQKIVPGTNPWQVARMYAFETDSNLTPNLQRPHHVFKIRKSKSLRPYSANFFISSHAQFLKLGIEIAGKSGLLKVENLEIVEIKPSSLYHYAASALLAAWLCFTVYSLFVLICWLIKTKTSLIHLLVLPVIAIILFAPLNLKNFWPAGLLGYEWVASENSDLGMHIAVFYFLTLYSVFLLQFKRHISLAVSVLVLAVSSELIQFGGCTTNRRPVSSVQ